MCANLSVVTTLTPLPPKNPPSPMFLVSGYLYGPCTYTFTGSGVGFEILPSAGHSNSQGSSILNGGAWYPWTVSLPLSRTGWTGLLPLKAGVCQSRAGWCWPGWRIWYWLWLCWSDMRGQACVPHIGWDHHGTVGCTYLFCILQIWPKFSLPYAPQWAISVGHTTCIRN